MKSKAPKKSRLTLDDLKEKGRIHNESLEAISGGVLGMGTGASNSSGAVDGEKRPPNSLN